MSCVPCALASGPSVLAGGEHAVAVLSRFPTQWGHVMVLPRAHAVSFEALPDAAWMEASALALRAARAVERTLRPARVYVAALGTSEEGLPMTFTHVHLNVLPVEERGARPRDVLTWGNGVLVASEAEWAALEGALRAALEG